MNVRKATEKDMDAVTAIYDKVHTAEENGETFTGWKRGIYPTKDTALEALNRDDLFVIEDDGFVVGSGILNKIQVDVYAGANWQYPADDSEVMVMHTLAIDPENRGKGYGTGFVKYYENYAYENGCPYLRIDTNETNVSARKLYKDLGYKEIGMVNCVFNRLRSINLILLEKCIEQRNKK